MKRTLYHFNGVPPICVTLTKTLRFLIFLFSLTNVFAQNSTLYVPGGQVINNNPNTHVEVNGLTKLLNPSGRTLLLERENEDSWLTFHDPGDTWYSIGIDKSDGGKFKINYGGELDKNHFVISQQGQIGIGTSNPQAKFEVTGGEVMTSNSNFRNINIRMDASQIPVIKFTRWTGSSSTQHNAFIGQIFIPTLQQYCLGIGTGLSAEGDQNSVNPSIVIPLSGNVGIGTSTPGNYKLAVEGKVGAREVNVTMLNWSDYVFDSDYKLPSLSEVEAFIKQNKHLPEVPSEGEVKENGVNLGEMDALLLKKIEELTLYILQLKKQIDKQNEEIEKLKHN